MLNPPILVPMKCGFEKLLLVSQLLRNTTKGFKFKLYLFYNDYETSYTTYINHARWHRCWCLDGLRVGGNWSARTGCGCCS